MNFSRYIAQRYFFAKSSSNAVNIITAISLTGILVGSAALIIVLSAFNGLEHLVRGFYDDFDPDLRVLPKEGKFFEEEKVREALAQVNYFDAASAVLEEKALFNFREKDYIASLKGVDSNYLAVTDLEKHIPYGDYRLDENLAIPSGVMGAGVAYYLGFSRSDFQEPVNIFIPKETGRMTAESFRSDRVYPLGIFSIQPEFDEAYVMVPLRFSRKLLNRPGMLSAMELRLREGSDLDRAQDELQALLGDEFKVLNRDQMQAGFLKVMRTEGLFTFLIFALILSIATFTIAGSLTMIMFEKRKNLFTLWSMGTSIQGLRNIILRLGLIISLSGGSIGLFLGSLIVWGQEHFQWISVGEGYIVDAYPVALEWTDVLLVSSTVFALGFLSSWLSARRLNLKLLQA